LDGLSHRSSVGGRLQGLKRKKVFYTIREMGLRSSRTVYRTGISVFISAGLWCISGCWVSKYGHTYNP
jgi:hypothetical protein